ncbi:MAG TPA: type 4a pilus biogenesis protein PilO [Gemmatimonadaceae bacterium]|nr:type 4a pilus biogenesis protein PilO [Gemmatimonadaceae bacterium]
MALEIKTQREKGLAALIFVMLLAIGAYWYAVYRPKATELAAQQERLDHINAVNERAKAEMAKGNLKELKAQLDQYQKNLAMVRTLVPTSNEVPALLEQISTAARKEGLDLASVDPLPVTDGESYATYKYNIAMLGSYHQLAAFLTNVGSLTRIVLPTNVRLVPPNNVKAAEAHQKPNQAVIEAHLQLQTYVVRKSPSESEDIAMNTAGGGTR